MWESRDSADGHASAEASALHETTLLAVSLLPADQQRVQADATAYADHVVRVEWPALRAGREPDDTGWQLLATLRQDWLSADVSTPARLDVLNDATGQLSTLADARRGRLEDTKQRMPALLWIGLVLGGVLTVALTFVYGIEQRLTHLGMVMGLVALIGFMLILVYNLDNPFQKGIGTSPEAFQSYFGG